jgi:hypothetical protein
METGRTHDKDAAHGKGATARQRSARTAKAFAVQFGQAHGNVVFTVDVFVVRGRTAKPLPGKIGSLPCVLSHGNDEISRSECDQGLYSILLHQIDCLLCLRKYHFYLDFRIY